MHLGHMNAPRAFSAPQNFRADHPPEKPLEPVEKVSVNSGPSRRTADSLGTMEGQGREDTVVRQCGDVVKMLDLKWMGTPLQLSALWCFPRGPLQPA